MEQVEKYIENVYKCFCEIVKKCDHSLTEDTMRYYWFLAMIENGLVNPNHYILELPYSKMKSEDKNLPIFMSEDSLGKLISNNYRNAQELDLLFWDKENNNCICFEIKFHRYADSTSAFAKPDGAGRLFNDMRRLELIQCKEKINFKRLFLYITDNKMDQYLSNPKIGKDDGYRICMQEFYTLKNNQSMKINTINHFEKPITFFDSASYSFVHRKKEVNHFMLSVRMCQRSDFLSKSPSFWSGKSKDTNCHIRLYEIVPERILSD